MILYIFSKELISETEVLLKRIAVKITFYVCSDVLKLYFYSDCDIIYAFPHNISDKQLTGKISIVNSKFLGIWSLHLAYFHDL